MRNGNGNGVVGGFWLRSGPKHCQRSVETEHAVGEVVPCDIGTTNWWDQLNHAQQVAAVFDDHVTDPEAGGHRGGAGGKHPLDPFGPVVELAATQRHDHAGW